MRWLASLIGKAKFHWNRVQSYLMIVTGFFQFAILVKVYEFTMLTNIIFVAIGTIGVVLLAFIDVKLGIAEEEISHNNKYNPEIQVILESARGSGRK